MSITVTLLNLKLPAQRLAQVLTAIGVVQGYVSEPNIAYVLDHWRELPADVQQEIRAAAPTFARLLQLAERLA